ncbi:FMN-linked oxidoreductase [Dendrothele bispora CBS 962.96]|uniref:FMN-linked oxidoreductase n=1 Tax=Dendrothele bispora (strain CBS 962.96) TaxID=1314807 RepID=A0A4S8L624_DENBC|nr:FMN-linked oxidoreductase [Dendrothele bispora CBS 962.96]
MILIDHNKLSVGGIVSGGFGFTFVEATAVTPEGRITPENLGIWQDSQIEPLKQLVDFAHSQGRKIDIQLAHSGRKGSAAGDLPIAAPSAVSFSETSPVPHELTKAEISNLVKAWADAARRALRAGFDVIQIHNAHGYLLDEFISPIANKRTDECGGSFENRIGFTPEVVDAVRGVVPESMSVFLRFVALLVFVFVFLFFFFLFSVSADEPSWTNADTIRLVPILLEHGLDFLDVSSVGNSPNQSLGFLGAQQEHAKEIKQKLLVGTVGGIKEGFQAEKYLQEGVADVVSVGRQTQKEPGIVWRFAEELGVMIHVANQIAWGFYGRGVAKLDLKARTLPNRSIILNTPN